MLTDRYAHCEAGVVRMLREFLDHGRFASLFDLPPVLRFEQEYPFPRGRADFVLFHEDGSLTVAEAKGPGDLRNTLGGIGQLLSYTLQAGMAQPRRHVRGILFAPVQREEDRMLVHFACERAGLAFEPTVVIERLNQNYAEALARAA